MSDAAPQQRREDKAVEPQAPASPVSPLAEKPGAAQSSPGLEHSPALRNFIHAGAFLLFAVPLGALSDPRNHFRYGVHIAIYFLLAVTLLNLFLLPRLETGKRIARAGAGWARGEWLYPFSVAISFALFPPFAAMVGWAAMAGGDAAASFFGRLLPAPRLPWNPKKTWTGTIAFVAAAIPFCFFALWWCPAEMFLIRGSSPEISYLWKPELPYVWTLAVLASLIGAILESLSGPADDNVRVPLGVGGLVWLAALFLSFGTRNLPAHTHVQPEVFLYALALNAVLGVLVLSFKFADLPGTLLGVVVGVIVYFFAHWSGYLAFLLFVAGGSLLSRVGLKKKEALGTAEARGGKRGIANVAANLIVPALCCLAFPVSGNPAFLIAYAGAIAAAMADTASSEIGTLARVRPVLITNLKPVAHGTNGAVTLLGFVAAALASLLIVGVVWTAGFFRIVLGQPGSTQIILAVAAISAAGVVGTTVDSLLGATIEDRVPGVGKGTVNFLCTASGASVAGLLMWLVL